MNDEELARRSIIGFGETVAAIGRCGVGAAAEIRWQNAVGAKIDAAADNHWLDAAVVPLGAAPPADDPRLPHCIWAAVEAIVGRLEEPEIAMPCMGLLLDDAGLELGSPAQAIEVPTLVEVAEINDRAYGNPGALRTLFPSLRDPRVQTHGLRVDGAFVVVGMTVAIGDDVSIQYVATEAKYRRRGLASRLLRGVLGEARNRGIRSATLQASPDGRPVYERLGFRRVATLRAFLRPPAGS